MNDVDCEVFDVNVDVVLCIDATGSMSPVIDMVKESALTFHERLVESLATYNREVDELRVKVIVYRDFEVDEDLSVEESRFFSLPQESVSFESFVKGIRATGGGDAAESSLDAIALAMRSDWVKEGAKKRHVIMLWTDAPTKGAGTNKASGVPTNNGEFLAWWDDPQEGKMNSSAKRLIVFAPECDSWKIVDSMGQSVWIKTALNDGLREMDMDIILNTLSASI